MAIVSSFSGDDVPVAMIVAMAQNNVIGQNNQLPWRIPADLKYFKSVTMGKPMVMGRKTFESIGKPLPGRTTIVVTTNRRFNFDGVLVAHSVDEALRMAGKVAIGGGANEIMVVGGAQLYLECLPVVDRLYLTEIKATVDGDAYFPSLGSFSDWRLESRDDFPKDEQNEHPYSFVVYSRNV